MQTPELINAEASRCMKRGIALLTQNTPPALCNSLGCFDEAIRLRQTLPLRENAWNRYLLAGGWMNRADALTRLGSLADAVTSYDQALALLQTLDLAENPLFRKRLALTWMNRGVTLQQDGAPLALPSFQAAIGFAVDPSVRAAALTNYGNALLQFSESDLPKAEAAFEEAISLLAKDERTEIDVAELALKARRGLCRALACRLAEMDFADPDLVSATTDAAEEALSLMRHWEGRGERGFQDLAREMIDFGACAYRLYQPHFLAEFMSDMSPARRS